MKFVNGPYSQNSPRRLENTITALVCQRYQQCLDGCPFRRKIPDAIGSLGSTCDTNSLYVRIARVGGIK